MAWTLVNTSATFLWGNNQFTSTAKSHAAGNLLVVLASGGASSAISSVTNTATDTFVQATNARFLSGSNWVDIWYVLSTKGNASDVITVNMPGTDQGSLFVANYSYSGNATFNVANHGDNGSSSNTATTAALATVAAGDLLVAMGFYATGGLGTWTAGSGFTLQAAENTGQGEFEDNESASAGSQTCSIVNSTGSTGYVQITAAAFSISAAPPNTLWAASVM